MSTGVDSSLRGLCPNTTDHDGGPVPAEGRLPQTGDVSASIPQDGKRKQFNTLAYHSPPHFLFFSFSLFLHNPGVGMRGRAVAAHWWVAVSAFCQSTI